MLEDYHSGNGHQIAVAWLFALYKELLLQQHSSASSVVGVGNAIHAATGGQIEGGAHGEEGGARDGHDKALKAEPSEQLQGGDAEEPMQTDSKGDC